jgi:endonuclease/exonuclease/phosphatase family metal-dependent hydrolase
VKISEVRVVSWNIHFRGPKAARRQGGLLRKLAPDLMLLQEVNHGSSEVLAEAAGADWMVRAIDLRTPEPNDTPVRRRGVAIAGHGLHPRRSWLLGEIRLSERILLIETQTEGTPFIAVSYHAPPGVNWGIVKPRQAVTFARWLSNQDGPLLFGADANTPLIDAVDFTNTRTHWHTGNRKLHCEPGDDRLFGPGKVHDLDDALRRWLDLRPDEMDRLRASRPFGPLVITHRTGRRKDSPGKERRFDSVWVSRHWVVRHIEHLYEEGIAAGSDHAPVIVDLDLTARPGKEQETWLEESRQHQSRIGSGPPSLVPRQRAAHAP